MASVSHLNKLTGILILNQLCFSMLMVVLFPHLISLGCSQLYLGTTASFISLIGLLWNPVIGSLSDVYGRKFVLVRLITIDALSILMVLLSNSLVVIFVARVISGFAGPTIAMLNSFAGDILTKKDQEIHYSRVPLVMASSMIVGPLVSGFLTELPNGYFLTYAVILTIHLINLGVASTLSSTITNTKPENKKTEKSLSILEVTKRELRSVVLKLTNVKWKEYSDIFSTKLCIELSCSFIYQSIGPSYNDFGVQGRALGYIFIFMSFNAIVANILLRYLKQVLYAEDNYGKKKLFHSATLFVLTACILSFSNTLEMYSFGMMVMSLARTLSDSTFTEALMARVSSEERGGITGAFESITSLCGLLTPVGAGLLIDSYGVKFILKMSIVPTIAGLIVTYIVKEKTQKEK
ncbi:hypothetical protein WA026_012439 [Henosepilachna vigintioctopunctata]|uniref:Major facilitator superfamily (MFS) profile domain-containing protein n=1 Tax=Henosepilachna vigintioctopunctata TaxID=420089 RepID=A0AAW1UX26_9CUCU